MVKRKINTANLSDNTENLIWSKDLKQTITTIPFLKKNEFDYSRLLSFFGESAKKWTWVLFTLIVIIIVTAVSNGANLTDGLDGLQQELPR